MNKTPQKAHRLEDYWYIEFEQKWEFDLALNYIAVMADFPKVKDKQRLQGGLTRRLTLMSDDGRLHSIADPQRATLPTTCPIKKKFEDDFKRKEDG